LSSALAATGVVLAGAAPTGVVAAAAGVAGAALEGASLPGAGGSAANTGRTINPLAMIAIDIENF
jgi:hypothetical protein